MELNLPTSQLQENLDLQTPVLTKREFEILHMAIVGFSNQEIQANIERTSYSVKWRLANIYHKFGAKDRLELIKIASLKGLQFITNGKKQTYSMKVAAVYHEQKSATVDKCL